MPCNRTLYRCMTHCPDRIASSICAYYQRNPFFWACWAVLFYLLCLPVPLLANVVSTLSGVVFCCQYAWRRSRPSCHRIEKPAWALVSIAFLVYWLAELVSVLHFPLRVSARNHVLADIRFFPFMCVCMAAVSTEQGAIRCARAIAVLVSIWTLDGLCQLLRVQSPLFTLLNAAHAHVFGQQMCSSEQKYAAIHYVSGIFGPCQLPLMHILACLYAFVFVAIRRLRNIWKLVAALAGCILFFCDSQSTGLVYALVLVFFFSKDINDKKWLATVCIMVTLALLWSNPSVSLRTIFMPHFSSNDIASAAEPTSYLQAWKNALCIIKSHPFRGVGVDWAYAAGSTCNTSQLSEDALYSGTDTNAPVVALEIMASTGFLGMFFWIIAISTALQAWRWADQSMRQRALPSAMALILFLLPFPSQSLLYSEFWGGLFLMLVGIFAGSLYAQETHCKIRAQ